MTITSNKLLMGQWPAEAIASAQQRIRTQVIETPLVAAGDLSEDLGQPLWLKIECVQPTGSFKVRGALNWVLTASERELAKGLITVSAGNHALALAWAARHWELPLTVIMPEGSSPMKIEACRALGGRVVVQGQIQEAVALCRKIERQEGLTLVHPYADERVIAGQGTMGLELVRQLPEMARILCPVGGGGLISGLGLAVKAERPDVELIGVEPEGAATLYNAWRQSNPEAALAEVQTLAASLAPTVVSENTYRISRQVVDRLVQVSEAAIVSATRGLIRRGHVFAETGATVGLAALLDGAVSPDPSKPTVLILTGGNMDLDQLCSMA